MSRKKRHKGRTVLIVLLVLIVIGAGGVLYLLNYYKNYNEAFIPDNKSTVNFSIAPGSSTGAIANKLEEYGLIKSAATFKLKSRLMKLDDKYQAGNYRISPSMTMEEIMEEIQHGKSEASRFTVPEGLCLTKTAKRLAANGIISSEEAFYKALEDDYDYWFLQDVKEEYGDPSGKISAEGNRLEGFLYPETYDINKGASAHDVIDRMLSQFARMVPQDTMSKIDALNKRLGTDFTLRNIVTVASIIEMETDDAGRDGPGVARVIYNRLAKKMNIQSDVTVIYAISLEREGMRVLVSDLEKSYSSPYSTYGKQFKGLPAGPICSPTADSIKAALEPVDSDCLYFCVAADGSGKLLFTSDYNEHLRNAEAWQKYMYGK